MLIESEDNCGISLYPKRLFNVDSGEHKAVYHYRGGAGSYTFLHNNDNQERCIFWRYNHAVLDLWEECLNAPGILDNRISIHVGDNIVMHCSVWENYFPSYEGTWSSESGRSCTFVLVATSNAVFKWTFHHPIQLRQGNDGQQLSIFYQMDTLCEQRDLVRRHRDTKAVTCTAFSLFNRSVFVYSLTNGQLYVIEMPSEHITDAPLQYELSHSGFIQKFWSALAPSRTSHDELSPFCATDLAIVVHEKETDAPSDRLLLLALYINCRLRVWDLQSRSCLMEFDLSSSTPSPSVVNLNSSQSHVNSPNTNRTYSSLIHHQMRVSSRSITSEGESRALLVLFYLHLFDDESDDDDDVGKFLPLKLQMDRRGSKVIATELTSRPSNYAPKILDFVILPSDEESMMWFVCQQCVKPFNTGRNVLKENRSSKSTFNYSAFLYSIEETGSIPCILNNALWELHDTETMIRHYLSSDLAFSDWLVDESTFSREAIVEVVLDRIRKLYHESKEMGVATHDNHHRLLMLINSSLCDNISLKLAIISHVEAEKTYRAKQNSSSLNVSVSGDASDISVIQEILHAIGELDAMLRPVLAVSTIGPGKNTIALHRNHGGISVMRPMDSLEKSLHSSGWFQLGTTFSSDYEILLASCRKTLVNLDASYPDWFQIYCQPMQSMDEICSRWEISVIKTSVERENFDNCIFQLIELLSHADPSIESRKEGDMPHGEPHSKRARHRVGMNPYLLTLSTTSGVQSAAYNSALTSRWLHHSIKKHLHLCLRMVAALQYLLSHSVEEILRHKYLPRVTQLRLTLLSLFWLCQPSRMNSSSSTNSYSERIRAMLNSVELSSRDMVPHNIVSSYLNATNGAMTTMGSTLHWFLWLQGRSSSFSRDGSNIQKENWGESLSRLMMEQIRMMKLDVTTREGRQSASTLCWQLLLSGKPVLVQELCEYLLRQVSVPELEFCSVLSYAVTGDCQFAAKLTMGIANQEIPSQGDVAVLAQLLNIPLSAISTANDPHNAILQGALFVKVMGLLTALGEYNEAVLLGQCAISKFKTRLECNNGLSNTEERGYTLYREQMAQLHMLIFTLELETRGDAFAAFNAILSLSDIESQRSCLMRLVSALDARDELHLMLKFSFDLLFREVTNILDKKCRSVESKFVSSTWKAQRCGSINGRDPTRYHRVLISLFQGHKLWLEMAKVTFRLAVALAAQLESDSQEGICTSSHVGLNVGGEPAEAMRDVGFVVANLQDQAHWLLVTSMSLRMYLDSELDEAPVLEDENLFYFSLCISDSLLSNFGPIFDEEIYRRVTDEAGRNGNAMDDAGSIHSGTSASTVFLSSPYQERTRIVTLGQVEQSYYWIRAKLVLAQSSTALTRTILPAMYSQPDDIIRALLDVSCYHEVLNLCCYLSVALDPIFHHLVSHLSFKERENPYLIDSYCKLVPNAVAHNGCEPSQLRWRILQQLLEDYEDLPDSSCNVTFKKCMPCPPFQGLGHYHTLVIRQWLQLCSTNNAALSNNIPEGLSVNEVTPGWLIDGLLLRNPKQLLHIYIDMSDWPAATELVCQWIDIVMNKDAAVSPALQRSVQVSFRDIKLLQKKELINLPHDESFQLLSALQYIVNTYGDNIDLFRRLLSKMTEYQLGLYALSQNMDVSN